MARLGSIVGKSETVGNRSESMGIRRSRKPPGSLGETPRGLSDNGIVDTLKLFPTIVTPKDTP